MFNHIDNLLRHLFISQIDEISEEGQVRFQPPDQEWRNHVGGLTGNALNVYLVDLRENRKLRSNERIRERSNGGFSEIPPPRYVDCHYLISAWSPATVTQAIEPSLDESALLSLVTHVLMGNEPLIPSRVYADEGLPADFPQAIAEMELPMTILPEEGFSKLAEFWGTVEWRWKPVVYLVVTAPVLFTTRAIEGAAVVMKEIRLRQRDVAGSLQRWFQIGGRIFEAANPQNLIAGALVRLVERDQLATTNNRGQFSFTRLPEGTYTLEVSREGFADQTRSVRVPIPPGGSPNEYDVGLSQ
jgi:Pvc16 N-terminal domain/Carboxypeptidase regulatory-like domain